MLFNVQTCTSWELMQLTDGPVSSAVFPPKKVQFFNKSKCPAFRVHIVQRKRSNLSTTANVDNWDLKGFLFFFSSFLRVFPSYDHIVRGIFILVVNRFSVLFSSFWENFLWIVCGNGAYLAVWGHQIGEQLSSFSCWNLTFLKIESLEVASLKNLKSEARRAFLQIPKYELILAISND